MKRRAGEEHVAPGERGFEPPDAFAVWVIENGERGGPARHPGTFAAASQIRMRARALVRRGCSRRRSRALGRSGVGRKKTRRSVFSAGARSGSFDETKVQARKPSCLRRLERRRNRCRRASARHSRRAYASETVTLEVRGTWASARAASPNGGLEHARCRRRARRDHDGVRFVGAARFVLEAPGLLRGRRCASRARREVHAVPPRSFSTSPSESSPMPNRNEPMPLPSSRRAT